MWKSTSSNGWEYFIVWKDLGSSPMYTICVLLSLVLFLIYVNHVAKCYNNWSILVNMKHELVRWLCIELNIGMVRGSNLGEPKLNFIF